MESKKETLKDLLQWESVNITDHFGSIIDAMAEVGYLIQCMKNGIKRTDTELLESQSIITEPLIFYRQLLAQINLKQKEL